MDARLDAIASAALKAQLRSGGVVGLQQAVKVEVKNLAESKDIPINLGDVPYGDAPVPGLQADADEPRSRRDVPLTRDHT